MNNDNNIKKWFQENGDRVELILELLLATIIAMIIASSVSKMEAKILYFARIDDYSGVSSPVVRIYKSICPDLKVH